MSSKKTRIKQVKPSSLEVGTAIPSQNPGFSLYDAIWTSIANEEELSEIDLGPTNSLNPDRLQLEYDLFYGTSPLSLLPSSCASISSRSASSEALFPRAFPPLSPRSASPPPLLDTPPSAASKQTPAPDIIRDTILDQTASDNPVESKLSNKEMKDRRRRHENRRINRQASRDLGYEKTPYKVHSTILKNHVENSEPVKTNFDTTSIPTCSTGFTTMRQDSGGIYDADFLIKKHGFKLIEWDGITSKPIVDDEMRVVMALIGSPKGSDWDNVAKGAFDAIRESARHSKFPKKSRKHRRGNFPALSVGISHGGGQKKPGNLHHSRINDKMLKKLLQNKHIRRIAGHSSAAFATWSPKLFKFYLENFNALLQSDPDLCQNFANSVWASATFNYGPRTVTRRHLDYANLPFGWCAITALGNFNPKKGGHLVLWGLKLVIEFPPSSTILALSAAVEHSNTPISRRETRCSFTQYTAGGIFRWVAYKCQRADDYLGGLEDEDWEMELKNREERCKLGLSLFSTIDELVR